MKKICAYVIGDTPINELVTYNSNDLGGNDPFLLLDILDDIPNSYQEVPFIESLYKYSCDLLMSNGLVQKYMKEYYESVSWEDLSITEKEILSTMFIVEKSKRDEVLSVKEQNDNDYFVLYNHLSEDVLSIKNISKEHFSITPKSIDYKKDVVRLHPEYIFDNAGFLRKCTYYENLNITYDSFSFSVFNFSNPVLKYESDYLVGDDDYVKSRTVTRSWYLMSGTFSTDVKTSYKIYEPLVSRDEGRRRRKNLINRLIIDTVGLFIITSPDLNNVMDAEEDAIPFMKEIGNGISEYYEYGSKRGIDGQPCHLMQAVAGSTFSRLDNFVPGTGDTVTLRMFLLSRLEPDLSEYKI